MFIRFISNISESYSESVFAVDYILTVLELIQSEFKGTGKILAFTRKKTQRMKKIPASEEETLDRYDILCKYFDGEVSVSEIARLTGVSSRTIWRQINAYREKGINGLKRQKRDDKGKSRKLTVKTKEIIEGLYLRTPKPSVVWVQEQISKICERDSIPKPSYWLVRSVCQNIDARLKVLAHEGEEAYEQAYEVVIRRNASYPNEMWQSDHTETKIWAVDQEGKVGKVWITAILDDYSRAVPGYFLGLGAPNSMRIASALRQAIWEKNDEKWQICGIPEILYTDSVPRNRIGVLCLD